MILKTDNTTVKPPHTIVGPLHIMRRLLFNLKLFSGWKRLVPPPPPPLIIIRRLDGLLRGLCSCISQLKGIVARFLARREMRWQLPLILWMLLSLTATAQNTTLVSNTSGGLGSNINNEIATAFTTGANSTGYTISSVGILLFEVENKSTSVAIRENNNGQPGDLVARLTNPNSLAVSSLVPEARVVNTFTAPAKTMLSANTTYFLVFNDGRASSDLSNVVVYTTASNAQTGADGWSIADASIARLAGGSTFSVNSSQSILFLISGTANEAAEEATVSLSIAGNSSSTTTEGSTALTLTATRSETNTSGTALSIPIQIKRSETTAVANDYTLAAASISIPNNSATGTTTFSAAADDTDETNETVVVELGTLPDGNIAASNNEVTITITDNNPTVVSLARKGSGSISEGEGIEFTVILSRTLLDEEVINVPLVISGTGVTAADWQVTGKTGIGLNTGVSLPGRIFSRKGLGVRFSDLGADTATLVLTPVVDGTVDTETFTIALGPDGATDLSGFDRNPSETLIQTNVGGGADPSRTDNNFNVLVNDVSPVLTVTAGTSPITEGTAARFIISASPVPMFNLTINLTVADAPDANFVNAGNRGSQIVMLPAGDASVSYSVNTIGGSGETTDEPSGNVTVTVNSGTGYTVGSTSSATVRVEDNDPTEVTLSVPDNTALEASSTDRATVQLSLNRALRASERLEIPLAFSGGVLGTDFSLSLSGTPTGVALSSNTVTFMGSGSGSAMTAEVLLSASSDADAADGTITVNIPSSSSGAEPILTATNLDGGATGSRTGNGQIVLNDDDTPALVFTATSLTVVEGASDTYTVRLATQPTGNVTVTVSGASGEVTVDTNSGTNGNQNTLDFTTSDWNMDKTVTVLAGEDDDSTNDTATLSHSASGGDYGSVTGSLMVTVTDNDAPALVFTPTSLTVDEGASDTYTVRLATQPTANVMVTVSSASGEVTVDTNSGTNGNQSTLSFTTSDWNSGKTVTVSAGEDDDAANDSATLTHSASGGGYGSVTGDVMVTVTDNDTPALVFSPTSLTVDEGASDTYTVRLATQPTANVMVTVSGASGEVTVDTDTGTNGNQSTLNFTTSDWNSVKMVTVSAGEDDDSTNDTATLSHSASGGDYGSVTGDVMITVTDDDDPAPATPVITIVRGASPVTEGTDATFTVTATPAPSANLTVKLTVAEAGGGDFVASDDEGDQTVIIPASGSAMYPVATVNDDTDEPNGSVTVTVTNGTGYATGTPSEATVTVNDDDDPAPATPVITIMRGASPVTEGTDATFTVTATPAPMADLTVNLSVAEAGGSSDFVASDDEGTKMVTIPTSGSATYTVATINDDTDEPNGSVTVTVTNGSGYALGSTVSATVMVDDDDDDPAPATPVITIAAGTSPVTEGTDAAFTVTATPAPASNLDVNLSVTEAAGSDFVAGANEGSGKTVTIPTSGSATYSVATVADDTDEPNGSVTVTVTNGTGYALGSTVSATVMVNDDDEEETLLGIPTSEGISIYPNPASNYFMLTGISDRLSGVSIISTAGKMVRTYPTSEDGVYDTSGLSEGIFFVFIETGSGQQQVGKIVIKRQ